jgi:insecticidal toxin complex protein TccC
LSLPAGNLLHLDNIANLERYYNNTLNKLTKADKTTQYNIYDYQGNRVRTVIFAAFAEDVGTNV